ncbi:MAG: hypothetical protein U0599_19325 [Vicinamibacteria bacterium]
MGRRARGGLAGLEDEPGFAPEGMLAPLARRHRGLRLPRNPFVLDGLAEYVLQQRVSFRDAARSHRRLVAALGRPAPGPPGLALPLAPGDWLRLRDDELRRAGVDARRAAALRAAARAARRVESAFGRPFAEARPARRGRRVRAVDGRDRDGLRPGRSGRGADGRPPPAARGGAGARRRAAGRRPPDARAPGAYRGNRFRVLRLLLAAGRLRLGRAGPPGRG